MVKYNSGFEVVRLLKPLTESKEVGKERSMTWSTGVLVAFPIHFSEGPGIEERRGHPCACIKNNVKLLHLLYIWGSGSRAANI